MSLCCTKALSPPLADWFLYIISNLVGLGTPLTNVTPSAENIFGEIFDLFVAVWSLSVAGIVIGIIGTLSFTTMASTGFEQSMQRRISRWVLRRKASAGGLDLNELRAFLAERGYAMSEEESEKVFLACDGDSSGKIDAEEVEKVIKVLDSMGMVKRGASGKGQLEMKSQVTRLLKLTQPQLTPCLLHPSCSHLDPRYPFMFCVQIDALQSSVEQMHELLKKLASAQAANGPLSA